MLRGALYCYLALCYSDNHSENHREQEQHCWALGLEPCNGLTSGEEPGSVRDSHPKEP
ncbi:hypothetical protein SOVF_169950 [Spinacia oleracea]|nr:hypothetical protein SOVF_169950 [Spinacia oleracea]